MSVDELRVAVWDLTPRFRRTLSHGRQLIVTAREDGKFGKTATEWTDIASLSEQELQSIYNAYHGHK